MPNTADTITPAVVEAHGLSPEEYSHVLHALGREPNLVELGIFSVMWSEHCSYKSSRLHLKKLPTEAPWVIQGPAEIAPINLVIIACLLQFLGICHDFSLFFFITGNFFVILGDFCPECRFLRRILFRC